MARLKFYALVLMAGSGLSYEAGRHVGLPGTQPAQASHVEAAAMAYIPPTPAPALATPFPTPVPTPVPAAPPPSPPVATLASAVTVAPAPKPAVASYGNNYYYGQCTYYVATRRPVPSHWGNANAWYYNAKVAGWAVGTAPAAGAIAWTGTGYFGHVAIVERVSAGQVYISEMNYNGNWNRVTYRWMPASSFRYIY